MLSSKMFCIIIGLFLATQILCAQDNSIDVQLLAKQIDLVEQKINQDAEIKKLVDQLTQEELQSGTVLAKLNEETKHKIAKYALFGGVTIIAFLLCYKGLQWISQSRQAQRGLDEAEDALRQAERLTRLAGSFRDLGSQFGKLFN